jgi:hypothetical protein
MQDQTTKVVTEKVRFSYCHIHTPKAIDENSEPKYSVSILIRKKDVKTLKKINAAIEVAVVDFKTKNGGKIPKNFKLPLRDGDDEREDDENYEGCYFISASSKNRPGILDENGQRIINSEDFYSGCYGRAALNFYSFNVSGNKGVACGLNNLQKLEDGENLGGCGASAEQDFGYDEDDDLM